MHIWALREKDIQIYTYTYIHIHIYIYIHRTSTYGQWDNALDYWLSTFGKTMSRARGIAQGSGAGGQLLWDSSRGWTFLQCRPFHEADGHHPRETHRPFHSVYEKQHVCGRAHHILELADCFRSGIGRFVYSLYESVAGGWYFKRLSFFGADFKLRFPACLSR